MASTLLHAIPFFADLLLPLRTFMTLFQEHVASGQSTCIRFPRFGKPGSPCQNHGASSGGWISFKESSFLHLGIKPGFVLIQMFTQLWIFVSSYIYSEGDRFSKFVRIWMTIAGPSRHVSITSNTVPGPLRCQTRCLQTAQSIAFHELRVFKRPPTDTSSTT